MTVYDFIDLCIDAGSLTLEVYSNDAGDVVYSGPAEDVPDEIGGELVETFDLPEKPGQITVNI